MKFVCILGKTAKNCQLWTGPKSPAAQDYLAALKYSCVYRERAAGADRGSTIMQRNANGNELEWKTAANEGNDLHCFWHLHCAAGGIGERIANWPNRTAFRMNEWTTRTTTTTNNSKSTKARICECCRPKCSSRCPNFGIRDSLPGFWMRAEPPFATGCAPKTFARRKWKEKQAAQQPNERSKFVLCARWRRRWGWTTTTMTMTTGTTGWLATAKFNYGQQIVSQFENTFS